MKGKAETNERNRKAEVTWDTIEAVQGMQNYIREHALDETFCHKAVYDATGYSPRHCERIFKKLLHKTVSEYIKAIRLSQSARQLVDVREESVLDIALESGFASHEGYSRAFREEFGISPMAYRKDPIAIPLFTQYPVRDYYSHLFQKEKRKMNNDSAICMVTVVSRPKRMLLLLRSQKAHDYWSYCEEKGCDWEGLFNSIPERFDTAAILQLPKFMVEKGTSHIASGVELPADYKGKIPEECDLIELEPCEMLYFQTQPFKEEDDYRNAIDSLHKAVECYEPRYYGYEYDTDKVPVFDFGATPQMGARKAIPVKK